MYTFIFKPVSSSLIEPPVYEFLNVQSIVSTAAVVSTCKRVDREYVLCKRVYS